MTPGFEQAGWLAHDVFTLVTGDRHEGPIHMHDQAPRVSDQYPFAGAIEHRSGLAQTFTVFLQGLLQLAGLVKSGAHQVNHQGADGHPQITAHLQPQAKVARVIEKLDQ